MNTKQLKKILKPSAKKTKTIFLESYIENDDSVTISYKFKGQKESHLKVPNEIWTGMRFEQDDDEKIVITNLNGITIVTNDTGWSRLVIESDEEDNDE